MSPQTSPRSPTRRAWNSNATAGPSTPPLPPQGGQLNVSGINENKTIACNDNAVTVSGISNTIVIIGHCASLTVSGMKNSVTVDAADTIEASGLNNQVTFHSGSPQISKFRRGETRQSGLIWSGAGHRFGLRQTALEVGVLGFAPEALQEFPVAGLVAACSCQQCS